MTTRRREARPWWRRALPWVLGWLGLQAVVAAAGGWQAWRWHAARQVNEVASAFLGAMRDASGPAAAEGQATPGRAAARARSVESWNTT